MGCSWPEIEVSRFKCAWTGANEAIAENHEKNRTEAPSDAQK